MRRSIIHLAVLAILLAGCATPPNVPIRTVPTPPNEAAAIDLLRQEGEHLAQAPFHSGNQVKLLRDGMPTYHAMVEAIDAARQRIDMESYEFDGETAPFFADLLLRKRAEGVQVHLVYDAWGSIETHAALFDRLRQGGVQVLEYNPLSPNARVALDINRRDHRKLLVVDGRVAITGGVNIASAYLNRPNASDDPERMAWRDTDVRIEGPAVGEFQRLFIKTWNAQHGAALPPPPPTPGQIRGPALVQAIDGAPVDDHPLIYDTLLAAISLARHSVHLTTGFFGSTDQMDHVLKTAARRGVDVTLVVAGHSNSTASVAAGRSHYTDLLRAGVRIFEREGVVLHAKTAVIDGIWSTIGSSNLDWRSVMWNNEIDAVIIDRGMGTALEDLFRDDMAHSHEITREAWARRPLDERIEEFAARLIQTEL